MRLNLRCASECQQPLISAMQCVIVGISASVPTMLHSAQQLTTSGPKVADHNAQTGFDSNQFGRDELRLITRSKPECGICCLTIILQISWELISVPKPETAAKVGIYIITVYCGIWTGNCSHKVDRPIAFLPFLRTRAIGARSFTTRTALESSTAVSQCTQCSPTRSMSLC